MPKIHFDLAPNKEEHKENIVVINGNEALSLFFNKPSIESIRLSNILLSILEKNDAWNEYFDKRGILKNPSKLGIRLKSNVSYPYTGELAIDTGHKIQKPSIQSLEDLKTNLDSHGCDFPDQNVIWISYRDPKKSHEFTY